MQKGRKRTIGEALFDVEDLLDELIDDHGLQWGDVLNLVHGHLTVHRPDAQEEYLDGSSPVFYYGPEEEEDDG